MPLDDLLEATKKVLTDAGKQLKSDLWKPEDESFLAARAKDLVGLNKKAAATHDSNRKAAYLAAARDVVHHVRLLAVIRMEVSVHHVQDALGRFFLEKLLPALATALPGLLGL
jgi:hypothetical protein